MSEMRAGPREGQRMFGHLVATRPPREGRSTAAATAASLGFHGAVLAALVWATMSVGDARAASNAEKIVLYTPTPEAPPPPTVTPPPPPKAPTPHVEARLAAEVAQPKAVATPEYKGFQTLAPPAVTPPDIPPPSVTSVVREADYSGEGVEGGSAKGAAAALSAQHTVTAEDVSAAPTFTPYTVAPRLKNRQEVAQALLRYYPDMLRESGVGGKVLVWFLIDENGKVKKYQVKQTSGHDALDQAALKVAGIMEFSPALNRDQHVPVWVALPVSFSVGSGTN